MALKTQERYFVSLNVQSSISQIDLTVVLLQEVEPQDVLVCDVCYPNLMDELVAAYGQLHHAGPLDWGGLTSHSP